MWEILQETCLLDGLFPGICPNIKDFSQKAVDSFSPPPLPIILCVPGEMVRRVRRGEPLKEVRSFSKLLLQLHHGDPVLPLPPRGRPRGVPALLHLRGRSESALAPRFSPKGRKRLYAACAAGTARGATEGGAFFLQTTASAPLPSHRPPPRRSGPGGSSSPWGGGAAAAGPPCAGRRYPCRG